MRHMHWAIHASEFHTLYVCAVIISFGEKSLNSSTNRWWNGWTIDVTHVSAIRVWSSPSIVCRLLAICSRAWCTWDSWMHACRDIVRSQLQLFFIAETVTKTMAIHWMHIDGNPTYSKSHNSSFCVNNSFAYKSCHCSLRRRCVVNDPWPCFDQFIWTFPSSQSHVRISPATFFTVCFRRRLLPHRDPNRIFISVR